MGRLIDYTGGGGGGRPELTSYRGPELTNSGGGGGERQEDLVVYMDEYGIYSGIWFFKWMIGD